MSRAMDGEGGAPRLCLALERRGEDIFEPGYVAEAPLVRFVAYTTRERVSGWVRLHADRLTDLLNAYDELELLEPSVEDVLTGTTRAADQLVVRRSDLVAVAVSGPRGDASRRRATRTYALAAQAGRLLIAGLLHAPVGADPLADFHARPPMVPLTDAWIEFWLDGRRRLDLSTGTLVVNRPRLDSVRLVRVSELAEGLLSASAPPVSA